jgi:transposase-like protein
MTIDPGLLDKLLVDNKRPEDMIGENGLLKQPTKVRLERALNAELTEHVGYDKHDPDGHNCGHSRNRPERSGRSTLARSNRRRHEIATGALNPRS